MEVIQLEPMLVTALISFLIPLGVGLITKAAAPSWVKSVVMIALATANGVIVNATVADGSAVISQEAVFTAILSFVTAAASYHSLLKPVGAAPKVQEKTANIGIG